MEQLKNFASKDFPQYENLIDKKRWKKIQDSFAEILNISLKTVNKEGKILVETSGYNPCHKLSQKGTIDKQACKLCQLGVRSIWIESNFYSCPLGFNYQAIPVEPLPEKIIAYVISGPFILGKRKGKEELINLAKKYQIDLELLTESYTRLRAISFQMLDSIKNLLFEVMQCLSQYYYQKYTLLEVLPQWRKLRETIGAYYFDKFICYLVEMVSKNISAERVSIMLYDPNSDELYIKAATGIEDTIRRTTRVKLGERIAGLAAKEMRTILIEEDGVEESIKKRLNNPSLKASVIMPFQHEGQLIGVINIGSSKRKRISRRSIRLIAELMNLSAVAIIGMHSMT